MNATEIAEPARPEVHWYLVHTKPRQETCALQNLQQQGYRCYLPTLSVEKLRRRVLSVVREPLFPRYLFIQLGQGPSAQSWSPVRSTKGVSRLVTFGTQPARVDDALVALLQSHEDGAPSVQRLFTPGERVQLTEGAFAGIEGIYQMADGQSRVMVLIELMSKPVLLPVTPTGVRKLG